VTAIEMLCLACLLLAGQAITTVLGVRQLRARVERLEEAKKP
jgi:hypothetical protein